MATLFSPRAISSASSRVASAVKFSAVAEYSGVMPNGMLATYRFVGDSDLQAEDLNAYELGWRWRPMQYARCGRSASPTRSCREGTRRAAASCGA